MSFTAKSVILDIADNYGDVNFLSFRSLDFWFEGSKITNIQSTDFVAYKTSQYLAFNIENSFDTSKSKLGGATGTQWYSDQTQVTNQRVICVFNSETTFDAIRINNAHTSGASTARGAKNVKITISDDAITSAVYDELITNSFLIYDNTFDEHIASNVEDEQILILIEIENLIDMAMDIIAYQDSAQDAPTDFQVAGYIKEDQQMDLSLVLQALIDLKVDVSVIGSGFQNVIMDAFLAINLREDEKLSLEAYFQSMTETKLDLITWQSIIETLPFDLQLAVDVREDGKLDFSTALESFSDLKMTIVLSKSEIDGDVLFDLSLGDGIIYKNNKLDISVGDGNKIDDVGLHLTLVSPTPIFKAIYGIHLASAIKDVT